jgi:hypothetical protein
MDGVEELGKLVIPETDIQNRAHDRDHGSFMIGHWIQLLIIKSVFL